MVARALACVLLVAALAGCAKPQAAAPDPADSAVQDLGLVATDTTGILRGIVVDSAIRPIANASVELRGSAKAATTGAEGAFGFDGLEPGTYFLEIRKPGYFPVQQSADVAAGDADPPVLKVILQPDAATVPFYQAQVFDGFIECTTSILVLCGAPEILTGQHLTNDRFAWDQYFADNASLLQAEMVWESTQALSPDLYFEMETLNDACDSKDKDASSFLNNTQGASPIYATVNQSQIDNWSIGSKCPIWMSIFSIGPLCTPPVPDNPVGFAGLSHCPGFTVEQKFTMYFHTFHGYLPPVGWRFTTDGSAPPPPA